MSTLRTYNLQSIDSGSANIQLSPNAGAILAGLTTAQSGLNITGGSVGIGTDDPLSILQVGAASTQAFYVLSDGRVGIGQTDPLGIFSVRDNSETSGFSQIIRAEKKGTSDTNVFRVDIDADTNEIQLIGTGNQASNINIVTGSTSAAYFATDGNVGIGTDNPTETLDVNGNISSDPIFITTYGAGNLDITTEQTVDLDLTLSTSGTSDFTVSATGVITVLKTGTYQVSYSITSDVTSGSGRGTSFAYLRLNGSGEQTASRTYMYNRQLDDGENTAAKTIMLPLTANDTLELRAARNSGTDTVVILEDYTTISLVRLT